MSFEAIRWARQQPVDPTLKSILVSLAERANKNYDCFPSFSRISKDTSYSRRSVIRSVIRLEKLGLIQKKHRFTDYGQTSNLYTLTAFAASRETLAASDSVALPSVPACHSPSATVAPKNENIKTILEKNNNAPPENPPICEPIVVVSEKPVLPAEPITTPELPEITPDLTVLDVFDAKEKNIVTNELKKVTDLTAQAVILFTLKTMIANNTVKNSPIAVVRGLINKAIDGVLVTKYAVAKMKQTNETAPPRMSVEDKLRSIMEKHRDAVIRDLIVKRAVYIKGYGYFYPSDFRKYGLIKPSEA